MRIIVYFVYCFPLSPQRLSDCGCFFGVLRTRLRGCNATRLHIIYFCRSPPLMNKFMRCLSPNCLRRDGDSNPGNPFGVYTLSRRASSTTRASLLNSKPPNSAATAFLCTHSSLFCTEIFYRLRIGTMQKRCKVTKNIQYHKSRGLFFVFFHHRTPKVHFCGRFIAGEIWKIKE